ncbi:cell wall protein IFF6-like, partial [Mizuhopecten yessoensis]|uniref:cell wall protein IFF6-like n=1 Tax=Mizuhopecten yessoensis TaxID=6573 RepID=UPI000B45DF11
MDSKKTISMVLTLILTGCSCQSYEYDRHTDINLSQRPASPYASAVSGLDSKSGSEYGANSPFAIAGSGSPSVVMGGYGLSGGFVDRNSVRRGSLNSIGKSGSRNGGVVNKDTMDGMMITGGSGAGMPNSISSGNSRSVRGGTGMGTGGSGSGMPSPFSSGNSGSAMGGSGMGTGGSGTGMPSPFSSGNSGSAMGGTGIGAVGSGSGSGIPSP